MQLCPEILAVAPMSQSCPKSCPRVSWPGKRPRQWPAPPQAKSCEEFWCDFSDFHWFLTVSDWLPAFQSMIQSMMLRFASWTLLDDLPLHVSSVKCEALWAACQRTARIRHCGSQLYELGLVNLRELHRFHRFCPMISESLGITLQRGVSIVGPEFKHGVWVSFGVMRTRGVTTAGWQGSCILIFECRHFWMISPYLPRSLLQFPPLQEPPPKPEASILRSVPPQLIIQSLHSVWDVKPWNAVDMRDIFPYILELESGWTASFTSETPIIILVGSRSMVVDWISPVSARLLAIFWWSTHHNTEICLLLEMVVVIQVATPLRKRSDLADPGWDTQRIFFGNPLGFHWGFPWGVPWGVPKRGICLSWTIPH